MNQALRSLKDLVFTNKKETTRTLLISEGFGFCFSLSCVFGYQLDKNDSIFVSGLQIIINLLLIILLTQIVSAGLILIYAFTKAKKQSSEDTLYYERTAKERLIQWGIVSAVLVLMWMPILLAYFPAIFSYDAEAQLYQVISQNYNTHHPLIHTLLLGMFMKLGYSESGINKGMTEYAVFQMIIFALLIGASYTFPWKKKRPISRKAVVCLTAFVGLFPVFGILAISTTKDIIFSGLVLLIVAILCGMQLTNREYIFLGIAFVLTLLFRNNAMYACVCMIACLVLFMRKQKPWKLVSSCIVAAVFAVILLSGLKTVTRAESGSPREALSIPIQQLARVKLLYNDELEPELKANLNRLIDDEWAQRYDEHLADPIKERISMKEPGVLVKTWIKLGLKYPGTYIDSWLLTTEGAWYVRDTSCNRIYGEGTATGFGYLSTDIRHMPEGFEVHLDSKWPELRNGLERLVSDNAFERIPVVRLIFAPALYFWLLILYVYLAVMNKNNKKMYPALFLLVYYLTLLLSPAILVRYMLPYLLAVPLLLVVRIKKENDNS